ncbi:MAG TPA: hypothetical protein VGL98_07955 [Gammaproteobacteria bacterium]
MSRIVAPLAAAIGAQVFSVSDTAAQVPGLYSLPTTDFVWSWGDTNLERHRGAADITMHGNEAQFSCELNATMRASSTMTQADYRTIEQQLSTRLDFIYAVSQTMNNLEYQRVLDWATLDCKKYDPPERSEEERATREDEAREKMLRELEKRRERAQREAE